MYCPLNREKKACTDVQAQDISAPRSFLRDLVQGGDGTEIIVGYVARTLDREADSEFQRHVQTCLRCQEAVAAQRVVWSALDAWPAVEVSPNFDSRLFQRLAGEQRGPWWRGWEWSRGWWRPAMPVAAACALLAAAFFAKHAAPRLAEEAEAQPRIEIEQVEHALDDMDLLRQLGVQAVSNKASPSPKI